MVAAALVASILLLPIGGANGLAILVKHGPPFKGTPHVGQVIVSSGCGAAASFVKPPSFKLTTGIGLVYGKSSAKGCGPPGFSDFGATQGVTGLDTASFVDPSPGYTTWAFKLGWNGTYNLSATPQNPAGGPFAWASMAGGVWGILWDLTTSSEASYCASVATVSTNGTASGFVNGSFSNPSFGCSISGTASNMTVGHSYFFEFYVLVGEYAYAPSGTSTNAAAQVNLATGAHHWKLHYWSVS